MAKKNKETTSTEGMVFADDMVDMVGTGKLEWMPKDKVFKVHAIAAAKLEKDGKAKFLKGGSTE